MNTLHSEYLILRIEESDEDGLVANFLMTASKITGYRKAFNKGDEIQLANDGRIQIQASIAAQVYNQPNFKNLS